MIKYKGNSIYEGIVIEKPYLKVRKEKEISTYKISEEILPKELKRFEIAVKETKKEIQILMESLNGKVNQNELKILNVHLMMLEDPVFLSDINNKIKLDMINAEKIVQIVVKKYIGMFKALNDPVYRQRAADIEDIGEKLINNLQNNIEEIEEVNGKILITKDLMPSELLNFYNKGYKLKAMLIENLGETSHVAILAKNLEIPTIMGAKGIDLTEIDVNQEIIFDSRKGKECIIVKPKEDTLNWYKKEVLDYTLEKKDLESLIDLPAFSKNNEKVNLYANIGGDLEIENIKKYKPDGVGLLRTEFIYMESSYFPTEEEQLNIYKKIAENLGKEKELIIRTLDIGADKKLSYFEMIEEDNPFLGLRATRLMLVHKEIFKTQLKAILRASFRYRNIKIMYPMIANVEELKKVKEILEECKEELKIERKRFNKDIETGIMIEIPSAAIMIDAFLEHSDFFSIGTNDLTQYTLAADRLSSVVSNVYEPYDPAVLRLINTVAEIAGKRNKKVSVCGEMAGDPAAIIAFLSFGIKHLSMLAALIPKSKKIIRNIDIEELKKIKFEILSCKTANEVKNKLNAYLMGVIK